MIWKILFFVVVAVFVATGAPAYLQQANGLSENDFVFLFDVLTSVFFALTLVYYVSLGWKKDWFSKKFTKICKYAGMGFTVFYFLFLIYAQKPYYLQVVSGQSEFLQLNFVSAVLTAIASSLALSFAFFLAVLFYQKKCTKVETSKKVFWKIYLSYILLNSASAFIFVGWTYFGYIFGAYNFWDYLAIAFIIVQILGLIAFVADKKIFNTKFWQGFLWAYIPVTVLIFAFSSDYFKSDFLFDSLWNLWSYKIYLLCLMALFVVAIYFRAYPTSLHETNPQDDSN